MVAESCDEFGGQETLEEYNVRIEKAWINMWRENGVSDAKKGRQKCIPAGLGYPYWRAYYNGFEEELRAQK